MEVLTDSNHIVSEAIVFNLQILMKMKTLMTNLVYPMYHERMFTR